MMIAPLLALALGTAAAPSSAPNPDTLAAAQLPDARKLLDNSLNDYAHARLKDFHAVLHASGMIVFCGQMNAPNKLGGMTGWQPVAVVMGGYHQRQEFVSGAGDEDDPQRIVYQAFCPVSGAQTGQKDFSPALSPLTNPALPTSASNP